MYVQFKSLCGHQLLHTAKIISISLMQLDNTLTDLQVCISLQEITYQLYYSSFGIP